MDNVQKVNYFTNRRIVGRVVFYAVRVVSRKVGGYFFPELVSFSNKRTYPVRPVYQLRGIAERVYLRLFEEGG
jgi:hypothetical protein